MARSLEENGILDEIAQYIKTPSLPRQFHEDYTASSHSIHVLQWNVLAQALSYTKDNFIRVQNDMVAFEYRKWRILEQIVARKPDLCALQEMDIFDGFLKDELPKYGYTCFFVEKINSKCLLFQNDPDNFKGPDGTLLCFKTNLFKEISRKRGQLPNEDREEIHIFAILELEHKPSSKKIVFLGTHLKARKNFVTARTIQTQALIHYLQYEHPTHEHIILAGDFNGDTDEPFYAELTNYGFRSAYRSMLDDHEPPYTTWTFKGREGVIREQCRTIDYIFYKSAGFTPKAILPFPSKDEIGPDGLPSTNYPSDHLALEVIFDIK